MSLTKPILNSVNAWDVNLGQTFTFNVIGGDQVVKNTLTILDNSTHTVVYTLTTVSYQYKAVVLPDSVGLTNGTYYSAYVVTYNSLDQSSEPSNSIQFYCYSTPTWGFSNVTVGTIVNNSSFAPVVSYTQTEGEALNDYTINLYDAGKNLLSTSGTKYTGSSASAQTVTHIFFGLEDNTTYYVRALGHTVGGTSLDTGFVNFSVSYVSPEAYSLLLLQNNCDDGYIAYYSLAYAIEGESNPSPPVYVTNIGGVGVDVRTNGRWVKYRKAISNLIIGENFTVKAWVVGPKKNKDLITLSNDNHSIKIGYKVYPFASSKVVATVKVDDEYFIYSEPIRTPANDKLLCIQVRKINNVYEVLLEVVA